MSDLRIIKPEQRDVGTAQTPGMNREAGVSGPTSGASGVWMGYVTSDPGFTSAPHHHGDVESGIYIISGHLTMRWGDRLEHSGEAGPGDFIFVPAQLVHQEINRSDSETVTSVVARGGSENIVVNVSIPGSDVLPNT